MRRFAHLDDTYPPGLLRRLGAVLYDFLIVVALWMLVGFIGVALNHGEANESPLLHSALFIVTFVFFAFFWMRSGMTLGMQAWRLRVQSVNGHPLTLPQCLVRFMVAWVSLLVFGLGYLWVLFDSERRSWHDIASDTRVVVLPKGAR
ncbi:RDD family protein [Halomonas shantousis]